MLFTEGNLLNFDILTSNEVIFNLKDLGVNHHKIFVRLNAFAACSSSLTVSLDFTLVDFGSVTTQGVFETGLITHTLNTLSVKITFGTLGQSCPKLVQDITVYVKQC